MPRKVKVNKTKKHTLPVIITRGFIPFPGTSCEFGIGREITVNAIGAAAVTNRRCIVVSQKEIEVDDPTKDDMYEIGVICMLKQEVRTRDGLHLIVQGERRVRIKKLFEPTYAIPFWTATYEYLPNTQPVTEEEKERVQSIKSAIVVAFRQLNQTIQRFPEEFLNVLLQSDDLEEFFLTIWTHLDLPFRDRQEMLQESSLLLRYTMLFAVITRESEMLQIHEELSATVQHRIDRNQREIYLREQIKAIEDELGDSNLEEAEYCTRIETLSAPEEVKVSLRKTLMQLGKLQGGASQEGYVLQTYLDTVLDLPWGAYTEDSKDITEAEVQLDVDHYGLKRVKDRILDAMAVHMLQPHLTGQILCLVGPPGVGKTSIVRSIARVMNRKYARVSLGGVRDEAEIRGHRKTYVGAMPGRIITAMRQAGTMNPVILLDEVDKLSMDYKGDPASALLEVLDSEQNHTFRDHYLEVPFDLSEVLFITTANNAADIPAPLYDRMDVIDLNSYTREEKFQIARKHLIGKQMKEAGVQDENMRITDGALYDIIDYYTKEAGVRNLERTIATLCRKCARNMLHDERETVYTPETLEAALGPHRYTGDFHAETDSVGIVNGLAWTSVGGVLMPLEVMPMEGKGEIILTGSLGDVMKESARIAHTYARTVAKQYSINPQLFRERDIHIHAPEGAVQKDGPSAGVTMVTAIVSAMSGLRVRHDIAMTGEITLHGQVLPIGGLVEKTMAAYKNGIRTVLIPAENEGDLANLDEKIRESMEFKLVKRVDDVLELSLIQPQFDTQLAPLMPEEEAQLGLQPMTEGGHA